MKKFLACLLVVALVICMLPMKTVVYAATSGDPDTATNKAQLYVKPGAEAGGDGSEAKPFATLQQAADQIAAILEKDENTTIYVNLMDGKHVLQETLTLGAAHSSSAKVVFQNAKGANPIITSGREIDSSKFALVAGTNYYAYQFTDADKINGEYPDFRELQVNGKSAIMAKSEVYTFTADVEEGGSFKIPKDALDGINTDNLQGAQLMVTSEWQVYGLHFGSITTSFSDLLSSKKTLTVDADDWTAYTDRVRTKRSFNGKNFYLQNHIALLDEPGEFYYDQSTGTIYYYPYADETLSECTVEYAMLDRLIYMENASNFVFDGLTFTGTSHTSFNHGAMLFGNGAYPTYYYDEGAEIIAGAICGTYTSDLTVQNCTFTELDTGAVMFEYGVKDFNITGNTFRELGMYAIALGAKQLVWNSNDIPGGVENVTISNNYVDHIGLEVLCATGIRLAKARNTKVLHNTVKNVPYTGIGMGMGFTLVQPDDNFINLYNVEIAYNHVENFMYNGNDGGAIYICGANATVDYTTTDRVSIHHNYIKANGYDKTAIGIYHDGSASNVHTYNNVIVDIASSTHGVIFTQEDVENQLAHNILIENNYTTIQAPTFGLGEEYNIVIKGNQVFDDSSKLPAEAMSIIQAAGVKAVYGDAIKPVQFELSKLDSSVHYTITPSSLSTVAEFKLTNNDTVARKLSLNIEGLPENITYAVSGNGVQLQPGASAMVAVTFTYTSATFTPSEEKATLKLSVVEECGRTMNYPRAISIATLSEEDAPAVASVDGVEYTSVQDAVNAAVAADVEDCKTVVLIRSTTETITVAAGKTLVLDLNGHTVGQIVVNGTLCGIDASTKDYNLVPLKVKISGSGTVAPFHKADDGSKAHAYAGYAADVDEDGYATFNYFEVKIINVTLRPTDAGIGYKLQLGGNVNILKMLDTDDAYGVTVYRLNDKGEKDGNGASGHAGAASWKNAGTLTKMVMIKNILTPVTGDSTKDAAILTQNATNMGVNIGVDAYLNINGEKVEVSYAAGRSLKNVLEDVNSLDVFSLSEEQQTALIEMYKVYALGDAAYSGLNIKNIKALVNSSGFEKDEEQDIPVTGII